MPSGLNQPSSEIEPIVGIQFGIFSPDEIERRSVVEITNAGTFDGSEPRIGGLFDPRMGVLDNGKTCRSCGQTNHNCPGHFGHYKLARPVYFIQFFPMIQNVLNCICIRCSKLLIDKNVNKTVLKKRGEARWRAVLNLCSNIGRCGQDIEDGCGARQPDHYLRDGVARIVAEWDNIENIEAAQKKVTQILECEYVLRLFRKITDEDVDFMGLNRYWCRPDWMICTVLPIPPPQVRPSVIQDNNQRSEDDLTHKLFEIISTNNTLQDKINNNTEKKVIDDHYAVLQYHVATLVDNQIPGVAPSAQRSGRPLKSIQQRLGSKEGRIRYNIQGKRVEFSGRSVITPDPNISIEEIGVPKKIAMNLTVPERVTKYNRNKMYKLIQNGADKYPGAKTIVRKDGRMISLKHVNTKEIVLNLGDIVNRHLMDGDPILFNRQPTLHRMSMMGHKVKVLPFNTFRLNVSVTAPYNADFDGDEMNAHVPQSYEASIELAEIAAVPKQIITPRHAKPVIGIVQDTLIGSYRITQPNVQFTRRQYMNMMMWNKHFNGTMPSPLKKGKVERYNGMQIISQILPAINMDMGNSRHNDENIPDNFVKIKDGQISQGIFDKDIFSKPSKGIIHTIFKDYGPQETVHFIDCMQNTIEQFLVYNGFSVGISDLIADKDTKKNMEDKISARKAEVENIIMQLHLDLFTNNTGKSNKEEFENRVFTALNKATEESGKIGLGSLAAENRLVSMVRAGSKGSLINIAQMLACVGQQAPEGRRIPLGFTDRTLPHFKKYDDGAEARGFVESSFIKGLSPQEFFFHAMSGREGLIDTAVKSVTGDTEIVVIEAGEPKTVAIGPWIDAQLKSAPKGTVEHFKERNMEYLELSKEVHIPTMDENGTMTWGLLTAITRHDPGTKLYEIKTSAGKKVIVSESQSLLIYNDETEMFEPMVSPNVKVGDCVPVTMNLPIPPIIQTSVKMEKYLKKSEYLYGTDYVTAIEKMKISMEGHFHIPTGWWEENNGSTFTLPYTNKAKLQRALVRSNMANIKQGYIYPFTTCRDHSLIPDEFVLNEANGIFLGLFLAEGNVDIKSGYVQISNNDVNIRNFVKEWFEKQQIRYTENVRINHRGTSSDVRGFSTILAKFLTAFVGHGAAHKFVPAEAFIAPEDFVIGVLNGYISGDGSISPSSIVASSVSPKLIDGISMLCSRLGIFGRISSNQMKKNNIGTKNILRTYVISIRSSWARIFCEKIKLIDTQKCIKQKTIKTSLNHMNYKKQNDVVLDAIKEINILGINEYPKLYDVTVPSTLNFGIANNMIIRDTADTGYIQRQLVKAMEDCVTQNDGSVRDTKMNIVQFHYGEDGTNSTMIESQSIKLGKLSVDEIKKEYGMVDMDLNPYLDESTERGNDEGLLNDYVQQLLDDQIIIVEGVNKFKDVMNSSSVYSPVNIDRLMTNIKVRFHLNADKTIKTDLTPSYVLNGMNAIIEKTQPFNRIWGALLRFYLAPHKLIITDRYTVKAFDTLCEILVVKNFQSWAQPGEQVGIIAAQSIGEPSTQMCLSYDATIVINGENEKIVGKIGAFIDGLLENNDKVVNIGPDSVVLDLTDDYNIVGVSNDEKTSWRRISQVSRHPANGGLVEITTKSGRKTTATLTHSFLTRSTTGVVPILGSELKVGTRVPIARSIPEVPNPLMEITEGTTFKLTKEFGWLCGIYLADGSLYGNTIRICKIHPRVEEKLREIASVYGWTVSTKNYNGEYGIGKDTNIYSEDLKNFLNKHFSTGSYGKTVDGAIYHANNAFISGLLGGYFDGDGNINVERQQIRVGSRSKDLIHHIARLLAYAGIFGAFGEETSVRIPDKIFYTYQVLKKYASQFKEQIGLELSEKAAGLDAIITYMERDGKHDTKEIYDKIPELGDIIAETGKLLNMPGHSRNYGRWAKKESVGRLTLQGYIEDFEEQKSVDPRVVHNIEILRSAAYCDILWDEITELKYLDDPKTYVYDFTVPGNDSFMVDDSILVHNTLNSVDWDTEIIIAKNGKIWTPQIGEFIDDYYDGLPENSTKVQHLANNQLYIELDDGNDWKALSTDEHGNMMWTQLEAITRHPVVNEDGSNTILEVELESGRTIKATKAKSFLIRSEDKIIDINGSDLKIGDEIPIANTLSIASIGIIKEINLREMLPPTEWLYGSEVEKALVEMNGEDRHWFQKNQGKLFTVPYNRSDIFRDAMGGRNTNSFKAGCVYPKRTRPDTSHIPETLLLTKEFGFFAGAYVAEGMSNSTQICITNNDSIYLANVKALMDEWNVGTHVVSEDRYCETTNIKGHTTSLIIHSTLLAKVMGILFGKVSYEKTLPDWVLQAPDEFVKGLVDGYISGDGTVDAKYGTVSATSVSKDLLVRFMALLARYEIFSTLRSYMPELRNFKSVSRSYTIRMPTMYSKIFAENFTLTLKAKQDRLEHHFIYNDTQRDCRRSNLKNTVFDRVKTIKEIPPMGEWVYDLTVENTRNFTTLLMTCQKDTFHLAGVASKSNVTRGVPRLKELLKVTQNPKAISLTIPLKKEFRESVEKARQVAQDLELTLLKDIVTKSAIYFNPQDQDNQDSVLKEDKDLIDFYSIFMNDSADQKWSKWLLRFEFDREILFNKNISMDDIALALKDKFSEDINLIYSDYNSERLIMRIRLRQEEKESTKDDILNLKKIQTKILSSIVIRGIPGIKSVSYRKDTNHYEMRDGKFQEITQYILDTDGSNFLDIMNHPYVDGNGVLSSHVHDIYENLGIEAARATLLNEITNLFADAGGVDFRHLGLLCDWMTRVGKLLSVDRYGINKQDIGPLAKASFEETEKILLKAALFGEVDPVIGVSANIMTGQPIKGGTGFSEILLDEHALMTLQKDLPAIDEEENEAEDLTQTEIEDALYKSSDDKCATVNLRMNVQLPDEVDLVEEPDVEYTIDE